ncbi:MAG TPA: hypothetical protein VH392_00075 [Sphingomicrobium sp.]
MILRRIREHVAELNWFAVAIDFIIVVVGVFVGIQASNWNQGRLDRKQAREYRSMLLGDLDANLENVAARKRYYSWVRAEALATLADLNRPSSSLDQQFLVHAYQATQIQPWALKRNTYDEILSVGAMAKLGDPLLRDKISNYYVGSEVTGTNISTVPPYREIVRRIMPYAVQQAIRARCNERLVQNDRGSVDIVLPTGPCSLGLDDATVRRAVSQVHDWPGLALDLNRQIVDLDQKLLSIGAIAGRAAALKAALEKADS